MRGNRKKTLLITLRVILCICLAVSAIWALVGTASANDGGKTAGISWTDAVQIRLILLGVSDFSGFSYGYGCGFSESFSVQTGGLPFCLAQDDCNSVYIKEWDLYYCIFEFNHQRIHEILSKYGISQVR